MEIISFNIWDLPLWFVRNRDVRMLEIAKHLVERDTDIICLQESWSLKHRTLLSNYLREHGYYDAVTIAGIKRNNGGLLTFSKFPITSVRFIPFGRRSVSVSEVLGNKGALETIIDTPSGMIKVLNTHLHYQSSGPVKTANIRLRQLRTVLAAMHAEEATPTILAGDFNEHNMFSEASFKKLFHENGFSFPINDHNLPTYRKENIYVNNWINRVPVSHRYDYIVTKNIESIGLKVHSYGPLYLDPVLSDHDPVSMVLHAIIEA